MADHDNQECHHCPVLGPLPSYAADTAGPKLHRVPVLRVSHVEEEGEAGNPWDIYRLGTDMYISAHCTYIESTHRTHTHISAHGGDRCYLLYPRASRDLLKAYPTLPAGQVPPEDDDDFSEYSVYSVEDYQDPEVPWDGDGDSKGWDQRGSGSGT